MESKILSAVGKVAGLSGIALGVLLLLFQEVLQKEFLPRAGLQSGEAFAVILSLMIMTFGIAGIGVIAWLVSRTVGSTVPVPAPTLLVLAALIAGVVGAAVYVGANARNAKGKNASSGGEGPAHITVSAASLCPDGFTIFYQVRTESKTGTGFNLPEGAQVCIVDASIKTESGDNVLVRDAKPSRSSSALIGPNGRSGKICRIMFDAIDKDPRNFNYPMGPDKKPEDCAANARVKQGGYGATHARIGCGYTSYLFGAPFSILQTNEDLIKQTAFKGLDLKCGWE